MEKRFYRICETLTDYGKYVPYDEDIFKHVNQSKPFYQSIYTYNEEQVKAAKEMIEVTKNNKTITRPRGIVGVTDVLSKRLVWDFDSDEIENAQKDTQQLVDKLQENGISEDYIGIYFSGRKGFHVEIETDTFLTPQQFKSITSHFAQDLETFDSVVANPARIFRIAYTKHNSTEFYKTRLSLQELNESSVQQVLEIAKEAYQPEGVEELSLTPSLLAFGKEEEKPKKQKPNLLDRLNKYTNGIHEGDFSLDLTKKPPYLSNWKYAISQGLYLAGSKHQARMILAATYKGLGKEKQEAYYLLKSAADMQAIRFNEERTPKEMMWSAIEDVYCEMWNGGTYSEDNFPKEITKYLEELEIPRFSDVEIDEDLIVNVSEGFDNFYDYATKIDENRLNFGIPSLDNILKPQKGHLIGLLAGPGVGKTSLALELLSNTSKDGCKSFFGSYDMNSNILFQKLLQRETTFTDDEIYDVYRRGDQEQIDKFKLILEKHYENVTFCFKVGQSIGDLKRSIAQKEQTLGEKIGLVVVDYIELILSDKSDSTQASAEAAQGLREIANSGKVVVVLLQPNKMSSKPDEAPKSYNAAKGSSAIPQAATSMMGCFRPGYNPEDTSMDKFFGVAILKNRMGPLGTCYFDWVGARGKITELEDIQKQELSEFLEMKKANNTEDHGL